jgi:hypothetical protein
MAPNRIFAQTPDPVEHVPGATFGVVGVLRQKHDVWEFRPAAQAPKIPVGSRQARPVPLPAHGLSPEVQAISDVIVCTVRSNFLEPGSVVKFSLSIVFVCSGPAALSFMVSDAVVLIERQPIKSRDTKIKCEINFMEHFSLVMAASMENQVIAKAINFSIEIQILTVM